MYAADNLQCMRLTQHASILVTAGKWANAHLPLTVSDVVRWIREENPGQEPDANDAARFRLGFVKACHELEGFDKHPQASGHSIPSYPILSHPSTRRLVSILMSTG